MLKANLNFKLAFLIEVNTIVTNLNEALAHRHADLKIGANDLKSARL